MYEYFVSVDTFYHKEVYSSKRTCPVAQYIATKLYTKMKIMYNLAAIHKDGCNSKLRDCYHWASTHIV